MDNYAIIQVLNGSRRTL